MFSPLLVLCVLLSPRHSHSQEPEPKHYTFHPYHQQLHHSYRRPQPQQNENRRHQRTIHAGRKLTHPVFRLKNTESSQHFSSPSYRYQPHIKAQKGATLQERHQRVLPQKFLRKPILINPGSQKTLPRILNQRKAFQTNVNRETRKISNTKLKLGDTKFKTKKKYNADKEKKDKLKLLQKDDNLAIESKVVETKVKLPKSKSKIKTKPQLVKKPPRSFTSNNVKPVEVPVKRTYNGVPAAPQFIIKQAGPSQQFGWVGHGTYAPLDIPNIFKAAGINTRWIPGVDEVFEAGLTYSAAPAPVAYAQDKLRIEDPVQEAKPVHSYVSNDLTVKHEHPAVAPAFEASSFDSSQSASIASFKTVLPTKNIEKAPVVSSVSQELGSTSSFEVPAPAPPYKSPVPTKSYEAPAKPPKYQKTPTFEAPAPAPAYKASSLSPSYEAPALAPAYKKPSTKYFGSQLINLNSSKKYNISPSLNKLKSKYEQGTTSTTTTQKTTTTTNVPSKATTKSTTFKTFTTTSTYTTATPSTQSTTRSQITYSSTTAPFYESPSPSAVSFHGSPTPSVFSSSPGYFVQPSYKPSTFLRGTSKPFTAFIGSKEPKQNEAETLKIKTEVASPSFDENKGRIDLEEDGKSEESPKETDDGEVFYIFYENEDNPLDSVKSGLDLQRYIQEEIESTKEDADFSASEPDVDIIEENNNDVVEPVFSIVEELEKPKQPIYFDVPIKIEENGEGFDPPTEIRTIFVPVENAINVPETFDISVGTSFGYSKSNKETIPSFSSESESSYNSPISSYDAPIAPSSKGSSYSDLSFGKDSVKLEESETPLKKSFRRVRRPKPKSKSKFSYNPLESSLSSIPYGTRLGPRDPYDPLVIRR